MSPTIAVVVKGYPRLAETFVAQELLGLERLGARLQVYSLRRPYDRATHPIHDEISAPVTYLPEYLREAPGRVLRAWLRARRLSGYRRAYCVFRADLARDRSRNRVRRFGQACVLAAELPDDVALIYAHFLHTPASVARYAGLMRKLPFSVSAHAKDIWTTPEWEKREKLADACWVTTCTRYAADHLAALTDDPAKVMLAYHGLDFHRFPPPRGRYSDRDGSDPQAPVTILSVGRPVPKKGYSDLLTALSRLPPALHWQFVHIGRGELSAPLQEQARGLELAKRIAWLGPQAQTDVLAWLRRADIFVLASCVGDDGDRDGLPNVLLEAQSQRLACVATDISGIPELIIDRKTGLLAPQRDPDALALAIAGLISDPAARKRLGSAGARRVRKEFAADACIVALAEKLGIVVEDVPAAAQ